MECPRLFRLSIRFLSVTFLCTLMPAMAQAQQMGFIRDAEVEATIRLYATPLFKQAQVNPDSVHIHIVNDRTLNAFVADGLNLFLNTGLIVRTQNAGELVGVIAHESGHIFHGDLAHMSGAQDSIGNMMIASTILGILAGVAARRPDVGAGVIGAGQEAAVRHYLTFSRAVEAGADTAALNFLDNLHQSSRGLLTFMQTLEGEELLTSASQDPYVRTHPLTPDRIEEIRNHVDKSPWSNVPVPPEYNELHARMRAKLSSFLDPPVKTLDRYKQNDPSIAARYARSIAYYRVPDLQHALPLIDGLIAERSNDPYFHELKGQMLFENGHVADAVPEYAAAGRLAPDSDLIRGELGQAEIEAENKDLLPDAIINLKAATARDNENADAWRLLSIAYNRSGQDALSEAALAEYSFFAGQYPAAIFHAQKAGAQFKKGSPDQIKMEDIRIQAELARDKAKASR